MDFFFFDLSLDVNSDASLKVNVAVELRNASSFIRLKMMLGSKSSLSLKIVGSGLNRTRVPFFRVAPFVCDPSVMGASAAPRLNSCRNSRSPLHTVTSVESLSAFTTEMPTPCRPPETWYPLSSPPNLPPACSTVRTVSREEVPVAGWMSVGMPRPSSSTETLPSASTVTVMKDACPAWTSSTPLSRTSQTMWCRPLVLVLPMYMPGRFRTGSRPLRTWMEEAP